MNVIKLSKREKFLIAFDSLKDYIADDNSFIYSELNAYLKELYQMIEDEIDKYDEE